MGARGQLREKALGEPSQPDSHRSFLSHTRGFSSSSRAEHGCGSFHSVPCGPSVEVGPGGGPPWAAGHGPASDLRLSNSDQKGEEAAVCVLGING